jgi:hypothetical protein
LLDEHSPIRSLMEHRGFRGSFLAQPVRRALEAGIGIHIGDVILREHDAFGDAIIIRLEEQLLCDLLFQLWRSLAARPGLLTGHRIRLFILTIVSGRNFSVIPLRIITSKSLLLFSREMSPLRMFL